MGTVQTREAHFVTFYSPGTFVSESSEREIGEWDPRKAVQMATEITERHNARPFGFDFETWIVTVGDKPVKLEMLKRSGRHYINGRVMTLAEVKAEQPNERILIGNMEGNRIARIVTGPKSGKNYRWTHEFRDDDVLLDADGTVVPT